MSSEAKNKRKPRGEKRKTVKGEERNKLITKQVTSHCQEKYEKNICS